MIVLDGKTIGFADLLSGKDWLHEGIIADLRGSDPKQKSADQDRPPARRCTNYPFFQDI